MIGRQGDIHVSVELAGDRVTDAKRRAVATDAALQYAKTDPLVKLKMALGRAYSNLYMGTPRSDVVENLRERTLSDPAVMAVAVAHHGYLAQVQAARSLGNRTADHIGQVNLGLLTEALTTKTEPSDAS